MTSSNNSKIFATIAAVCFGVMTIHNVLSDISAMNSTSLFSLSLMKIFIWVSTGGMSIALYSRKEKNILIFSGINLLFSIISLISFFSLEGLFGFVAYASLIVALALAEKGDDLLNKLWIAPAISMLIYYLFIWFRNNHFANLEAMWKYMIFGVLEIAGLAFAGLWIKNKK